MAEKNEQKNSNTNMPPIPGRPGGGAGNHLRGAVVKPKDFKGTIKRLWSYFGKNWLNTHVKDRDGGPSWNDLIRQPSSPYGS